MLKATCPSPIFYRRWRGEHRPLVDRRVLSIRLAHYQQITDVKFTGR